MTRYVHRPRSHEYFDEEVESLIVSYEVDDARQIDTGLVDPLGNSIYRVQDPIGFIWPKIEE